MSTTKVGDAVDRVALRNGVNGLKSGSSSSTINPSLARPLGAHWDSGLAASLLATSSFRFLHPSHSLTVLRCMSDQQSGA